MCCSSGLPEGSSSHYKDLFNKLDWRLRLEKVVNETSGIISWVAPRHVNAWKKARRVLQDSGSGHVTADASANVPLQPYPDPNARRRDVKMKETFEASSRSLSFCHTLLS